MFTLGSEQKTLIMLTHRRNGFHYILTGKGSPIRIRTGFWTHILPDALPDSLPDALPNSLPDALLGGAPDALLDANSHDL